MPRTFDCPKCGAPVNYSNGLAGQIVTCNYCGSRLAEPNPILGTPAQIIQLKIDASGAASTMSKGLLVLILIPVFALLAGLIAAGVSLVPLLRSENNKNVSRPTSRGPGPMGGKQTRSGPASVLLQFGSEGMGPGMFTDARSIAVDAAGKIYVGEYGSGRVQVFDPNGKFITQWNVDPKMPLRGMTADRSGTVYVVQSGKALRYDGSTGSSWVN